jgi:hypothetical protein
MSTNDDQQVETENISSMRIKPPAFAESSVPTWFRILEAQFHLAKISSTKTKFYHALSQLPPDVVDRLPQPSLDSESYDVIKQAVITTFEQSKLELFNGLMSKQNYNGKPSLYLQEMLRQATKLNIGDDIVRMQFLKTLPLHVQTTLASHVSLSLQQLAEIANDLVLMVPPTTVMAVSSPSPAATSPATTSRASTNIGLKPFHPNQRPHVCRAHIFYGSRAKTCKPWCKWPNKTNVTLLPNSRPSSPIPSGNE